ncbi:uncharacterized protein LOC128836711 [Malaclemys terrapin pileata]|uniref:uncharacterized protein LOC128829632 n=1 Tax=Malaclemys terrapin pileata TaxID=2991368 RepID=UPI0023A83A7D|nr:uncharacterized protein LOC128829632 [Malaclemys terrapin pileata]XP_053883212.1 uncharacterized protein LOC128836711 [Malaclemys terrapin pileata]
MPPAPLRAPPEMCLRGAMLALCCVAAAAWLQVSVGPSPVRARPGQRVVLECLVGADYPPLELEQLQVRWRHEGRTVLEFAGAVRAARAGLSLAEDEVRNGNVSLVLQRVTASDSGEWTCYILYPPDQAQGSLTLRVADPTVPPNTCPLGVGAPRLRQLEEVIGGCVRSASELQRHLARLAAEVKECLGSPEAEESPPRAQAESANQTAQA